MGAPSGRRLEIRLPYGFRIYILIFGIVWCGFVVSALFTADSGVVLIPLLMLVFGGTLIFRMANLAVIADDSGLRVRNYFRTKQFTWSEVEDFRIGSPAMMPYGKAVHALLRDGEMIALDATMGPWFFGRSRAKLEGYVSDLRSWLPGELR